MLRHIFFQVAACLSLAAAKFSLSCCPVFSKCCLPSCFSQFPPSCCSVFSQLLLSFLTSYCLDFHKLLAIFLQAVLPDFLQAAVLFFSKFAEFVPSVVFVVDIHDRLRYFMVPLVYL